MTRADLAVIAGLTTVLVAGLAVLNGVRPPPEAAAGTPAAASRPSPAPSETLAERPAPVPLHLKHRTAFGTVTVEALIAASAGEATSGSARIEPGAQESIADEPGAAGARGAAEADGYRDVRVLGRAPDGSWRASGLRGRTRVFLTVDPAGAVSAD